MLQKPVWPCVRVRPAEKAPPSDIWALELQMDKPSNRRTLRTLCSVANPSPQPPPRNGEGEEEGLCLLLPLSVSGRGLGEGFAIKLERFSAAERRATAAGCGGDTDGQGAVHEEAWFVSGNLGNLVVQRHLHGAGWLVQRTTLGALRGASDPGARSGQGVRPDGQSGGLALSPRPAVELALGIAVSLSDFIRVAPPHFSLLQ